MATTRDNYEALMMDALDGTLDAAGRAALSTYFVRYPEERLLFERMAGVETVLRALPAVEPPAQLTERVMRASGQVASARQVLNWAQVGLIVVASSLLLAGGAVVALAVFSLFTPSGPEAAIQAMLALATRSLGFASNAASIGLGFMRAIYSQPLAWLVTAALFAVVAAWMWVVAGVWQAGSRLARAV